jgi:uncharacterized protein (TIGR02246 family)
MKKLMNLLLVLSMAGCMQVPETDLEGLKGMEDVWQSALDAKDPDAMAAMYADDSVLLPPNSEAISGRAAIQAFWIAALATGINGAAKDTEVYAHSDIGYTVGTYTATDAGGAIIDEGKYVIIWRNVDGEWKIHRDIWNSNLPLPSPD